MPQMPVPVVWSLRVPMLAGARRWEKGEGHRHGTTAAEGAWFGWRAGVVGCGLGENRLDKEEEPPEDEWEFGDHGDGREGDSVVD
jgi:hypothetical protein